MTAVLVWSPCSTKVGATLTPLRVRFFGVDRLTSSRPIGHFCFTHGNSKYNKISEGILFLSLPQSLLLLPLICIILLFSLTVCGSEERRTTAQQNRRDIGNLTFHNIYKQFTVTIISRVLTFYQTFYHFPDFFQVWKITGQNFQTFSRIQDFVRILCQ